MDFGVELPRRVPEGAQRAGAAAVVPHARCDDAAASRDSCQLPQAGDGIGHEVDDELRQRGVELVVGEGQLFGRRLLDGDAGMPLARGCDERLRRVDGRHLGRSEQAHELRRQRTRPAADVQHALPGANARQRGQLRREPDRVAAHEPVVGLGGDCERHCFGSQPSRYAVGWRRTSPA